MPKPLGRVTTSVRSLREISLKTYSTVFYYLFFTNAYILRCKHVTKKTKKLVFLACVVYTLIYGSENYCATSSNIAKMTSFYNNCVRSMLEVSKWRQWKMRATTADLNAMLGVEHLRYYIDQRALRWLGHIQRMKPERLPKRLMYSYIPGVRRPAGGQTRLSTEE